MKQYLVISDIHGSLGGAKLMCEAFRLHKADAILCLGDVLYHGPRNDLPEDYAPKEVIRIMNEHAGHIIAVRGNCDAEVDHMVLDFPMRADYSEMFLGSRRVFMTHGHVYGPDHMPLLGRNDILLYGHTHIPVAETKDGTVHLNPGSCALPKQNHPKSYGILSRRGFTIFDASHREYRAIRFD